MNRNELSRRNFFKRAFFASSTVISGPSAASSVRQSSDAVKDNATLSISVLTSALRTTGRPNCIRESERLDSLPSSESGFDLHLRRAKLQLPDAVVIAEALHTLGEKNSMALRSFSVSHNPELKDAGVIALIDAFPSTLTEVGLVGCGFGDTGADALLAWVNSEGATNLRMICLEQNRLSTKMQHRFSSLREKRSNLMVVT